MEQLLRHRQTKEAATDRLYLRPPRHISTLPNFPVYTGAVVRRRLGNERQVIAQTRNFSQGLYNQPLNEENRPNPEVQNSGLEGRKVLVLPVANSNQGGRW
jgi:hypothetical protein